MWGSRYSADSFQGHKKNYALSFTGASVQASSDDYITPTENISTETTLLNHIEQYINVIEIKLSPLIPKRKGSDSITGIKLISRSHSVPLPTSEIL